MRRLLLITTGFAAGYVLGAKAGRERYEEIANLAGQAWHGTGLDRSARRVRAHAGETARTAAHQAGDKIADGAVTVIDAAKDKISSTPEDGSLKRSTEGDANGKSAGGRPTVTRTS